MRAALACFLHFAFRRFAAPERFRHQRVIQHEPGVRHVGDRQQHLASLAGAIIAANADGLALDADDQAAKAALSCNADRHLDLRGMARTTLEIRAPHQWAVKAWGGY